MTQVKMFLRTRIGSQRAKKLVVGYCRVSTLEQKRRGYGIDIQIRDVTVFAERSDLLIRRFYTDEAESGVATDRQELQ